MRHPLILSLLRHRYSLLTILAFGISLKILIDTFDHSISILPVIDRTSSAIESDSARLPDGAPQMVLYAALLERPIFSRTRRPYVPPQPEPPVVEQPTAPAQVVLPEPEVTLQGIYIRGNSRQALIHTPENSMPVWVNEGANISAWKLAEIKPNQLILLAGTQRRIIELYVEKPQLYGN